MIGKTGVIICGMCSRPCEKDVFYGGRGVVGQEPSPVYYCSEECRDDHQGFRERIESEADKSVRKEFKLIHDCVCPSCVRRLKKLV